MILALFGVALTTAYLPGISGAGTAPRWLVCALVLVMLVRQRITVTPAHLIGALLLMWAGLSCLWTEAPYASVDALWKLMVLAGLFALGTMLADLRPFWRGAIGGIGVSSLLVVAERLGLIGRIGATDTAGLFVNGLFLAEAAAVIAVAASARLRTWWPWLIAAPSLLLVHWPRGPWLAIGCVGLIVACRTRVWLSIAAVPLIVLAVVVAVIIRPDTVLDRMEMWRDALGHVTVFGHGLGSYSLRFLSFASTNDHPHNEWIETFYELGLPGLVILSGLVVVLLRGAVSDSAERYGLIVILAESMVAFPLHLPTTAALAALLGGHAARALPDWRDALDHGGDRVRAWLGCPRYPAAEFYRMAVRHRRRVARRAGLSL